MSKLGEVESVIKDLTQPQLSILEHYLYFISGRCK